MFPVLKSFRSLAQAKLAGIVAAGAFFSVISVILLVLFVTSVAAFFTGFESGWINTLINWSAGIATGIAGWFILPAFMIFFAGLFQERIIVRVERTFYPDAATKDHQRFWPDLIHDLRFTGKALILNIIILPLYLFGFGFFLSILLNTYLLGREFFETVAGYHMGKPAARELGRKNSFAVYGGGFVIVMMTLIPLLNLIMPVLATVWMVHVFHSIQKNQTIN